MRNMLIQALTLLVSKLGRCPHCMRSSFIVAGAAWTVCLVATAAISRLEISLSIAVVALGLTVLWIAHLFAFVLRTTEPQRTHGRRADAASGAAFPRRVFIAELAKSMGLVALATAFPVRSWAQKPCEKCEGLHCFDKCKSLSGKQRKDCCDCEFNNCLAACKGPNPPIGGPRAGDCERGCGAFYVTCAT